MNDLIYCAKELSQTGSCSCLAKYKVVLQTKLNPTNGEQRIEHRCETHKQTATAKKKVIEISPIDQTENLKEVNIFLKTFIGKIVPNKRHGCNPIGRYLKDNGGIMCQNPVTLAWKYIYYNQIIKLRK